jgi:O-succinylhomoserine sulfhydrylase
VLGIALVNAWVFLKGLQTLPLRMRAHCDHALEVAHWLVDHPASNTHSRISADERKAAGIGDELVRVVVGLEPPADIIVDLARGLDHIKVRPRC